MQMYDFIFAIKPDIAEETRIEEVEKIKAIITNNGGEITTFDEWGNKKLAYLIEDYDEAIYYLMQFKSSPDNILEMDRLIKLNLNILRHIIVKLDKELGKKKEKKIKVKPTNSFDENKNKKFIKREEKPHGTSNAQPK